MSDTCPAARYLEAVGISQAELARRSGLSESALSRIINRRRLCTLKQADALDRATGGAIPWQEMIRWGREAA